jgi:hypothetical protein
MTRTTYCLLRWLEKYFMFRPRQGRKRRVDFRSWTLAPNLFRWNLKFRDWLGREQWPRTCIFADCAWVLRKFGPNFFPEKNWIFFPRSFTKNNPCSHSKMAVHVCMYVCVHVCMCSCMYVFMYVFHCRKILLSRSQNPTDVRNYFT